MRVQRKGYTLVELLMVMSIVAITSAMVMPVFKAGRAAAYQFVASSNLHQLGTALKLYVADYDEQYPPAMATSPDKAAAWFGTIHPDRSIDTSTGVFQPYTKSHRLKDPVHEAKQYMGDQSGFGYNWYTLGSDTSETNDPDGLNNGQNPAHETDLENESGIVAFATSAYFFAPWNGGDGQWYDYGFISPPSKWNGVPDVDFRHLGTKQVITETKRVMETGSALVLFTDGSAKPLKRDLFTDKMFARKVGQNQPSGATPSPQ